MKPFLRVAVFCEDTSRNELDALTIVNAFVTTEIPYTVHGTVDLSTARVERPLRAVIFVNAAGQKGLHRLDLRFVNSKDEYLPGSGGRSYELTGAPGEEGARFEDMVVLDMPVANDIVRLMIEWDRVLIGWIPLRVTFVRKTRGES